MDRHIRWLRPREYLQIIVNAAEAKKKSETRREIPRKNSARFNIQSNEDNKDATPKDAPLKDAPSKDAAPKDQSINDSKGNSYLTVAVPPPEAQASTLPIAVVKMKERDETPEETQKRLALLEEEKKKGGKKKPAGKPKAEDLESKKVKEAVLGDLSLALLLPKYSKWATSQIQFIKDRNIVDSYVVLLYKYRVKSLYGSEFILNKMEFQFIIPMANIG